MRIIPIDCKYSEYHEGYDPEIDEECPYCLCLYGNKKDFCECHYGLSYYRYANDEIECKKLDENKLHRKAKKS